VEQGVRYLVDQEGVDLVATGEEVVGDAHEIFDDHGEFLKTESGRAFRVSHGSGVCAQMFDVFRPERSHAAGQFHRLQLVPPNQADEPSNAESGGPQRVRRREQSSGNDLPSRDRPPTGSHDIGLADVSDQFTDLPRRQTGTVRVDDRGVPDESGDVVF